MLYGVKEVGDPTVEKVKCYQTAGSTTGGSWNLNWDSGLFVLSTSLVQVWLKNIIVLRAALHDWEFGGEMLAS